MKAWLVILIILVVLSALFIIANIIYNKFQNYIIRINEVEGKIDETLRNKFDNILKINNIIKERIKTKKELVDDLEELKNEDKSSFEIHRILTESYNKIDFVRKQYKEASTSEEINKLFYEINDMDESLKAYIKFYNENIVGYNSLIRKFPYNLVGIVLKYEEKMFFDGKDLNDDNIKDFKL